MDGSAPTTLTDALNKEFESANGIKVKYEVQKWTGIQEKLTTALASSTPPDVIELGNTQTASFADQGTLADLTADAGQFNSGEWLGGLKDSLTLNGKQYGVPFYAANRTVIYRTDLFQAAVSRSRRRRGPSGSTRSTSSRPRTPPTRSSRPSTCLASPGTSCSHCCGTRVATSPPRTAASGRQARHRAGQGRLPRPTRSSTTPPRRRRLRPTLMRPSLSRWRSSARATSA